MSLESLALLLVAAVLHTAWNLRLKREEDRAPVLFWALLLGSLAFLPALAFAPRLTGTAVPYLAGSAVCEALYFAVLTAAYARGDFSLVYPIARGSVPALLALGAIAFLGERLSWKGAGGIALVIAGLLLLAGGQATASSPGRPRLGAGSGLALLTALLIAAYSLVDAAAVRRAPTLPYTIVVLGASALLLAPFLIFRYGWRQLAASLRRSWLSVGIVAICLFSSYALVLRVYAVERVAYAAAVREISIVFAAIAGAIWLDEAMGWRRILGASLAFAGILVLA